MVVIYDSINENKKVDLDIYEYNIIHAYLLFTTGKKAILIMAP